MPFCLTTMSCSMSRPASCWARSSSWSSRTWTDICSIRSNTEGIILIRQQTCILLLPTVDSVSLIPVLFGTRVGPKWGSGLIIKIVLLLNLEALLELPNQRCPSLPVQKMACNHIHWVRTSNLLLECRVDFSDSRQSWSTFLHFSKSIQPTFQAVGP